MSQMLDWEKGFVLPMLNAELQPELWSRRYLSQMKHMFSDTSAVNTILQTEDPLIYEFQELGVPELDSDLAFGVTRIYPGTIGDEYYMTKGHFHNVLNTAEVYLGISGNGILLTENLEGDCNPLPLAPMQSAYVGKGYAHRSINTGSEPLVLFFVYRADIGHNYGSIETRGFRNLLLKKNGVPALEPNPNWNNSLF